jgi:hypothetical protein
MRTECISNIPNIYRSYRIYIECEPNISNVYRIYISNVYRINFDKKNSDYKMIRYLRSDVSCLSDKDIQDIINARNSMKRASEVMANKYKISSRRVYQIWRGDHPPIDPSSSSFTGASLQDKDKKPSSEETVSLQQVEPTECNVTSGSKVKKNVGGETSPKGTSHRGKSSRTSELSDNQISSKLCMLIDQNLSKSACSEKPRIDDQELNALYEKEAKRSKKNKSNVTHLFAGP